MDSLKLVSMKEEELENRLAKLEDRVDELESELEEALEQIADLEADLEAGLEDLDSDPD